MGPFRALFLRNSKKPFALCKALLCGIKSQCWQFFTQDDLISFQGRVFLPLAHLSYNCKYDRPWYSRTTVSLQRPHVILSNRFLTHSSARLLVRSLGNCRCGLSESRVPPIKLLVLSVLLKLIGFKSLVIISSHWFQWDLNPAAFPQVGPISLQKRLA